MRITTLCSIHPNKVAIQTKPAMERRLWNIIAALASGVLDIAR